MDKKQARDHLTAVITQVEQDSFWAEEFRKMDQWRQAIWDQHQRRPTEEEYAWYYDTQCPFTDGE